ncbi:helicase-related protein [Sphingomonas sp.]|uniref:helicase-related protein n=1 Tax=Sphingomonas sp. TaxID=28214 RepID=UPI003AFFE850
MLRKSGENKGSAAGSMIAEPLGIAEAAFAIAEMLGEGDMLFAAADEARGAAIARAIAAADQRTTVLFVPGSDALPGDDAPASPANAGQRAAALRRLRVLASAADRPRIACVTTGEALARRTPPPAAFDTAPPLVRVGAELDLDAIHAKLCTLGYVDDDRVDEPGEVALRGVVLDVFPVDAARPLRIEVADGRVATIAGYDALTQRTTDPLDEQELGRVGEPPIGDDGVALPDHLVDARLMIEPQAEERRRRFLALAADLAKRLPKRAMRDVLDEKAWAKVASTREQVDVRRAGEPPARFVEGRRPVQAFAKVARAAREAGDRVVLLGAERDLRFLGRRLAKALGEAPARVDDLAAILAAPAGALLALAMPADRGFARPGLLAVAAADLLGSRALRDDAGTDAAVGGFAGMGAVRLGDVVVHEDHGIGVAVGIEALTSGEGVDSGDAIRLEYADEDVRLVPVDEADRLWRYGAERDAVSLDKLNGSSWTKRRAEIDAAIAESARELTRLAAEREGRGAPAFEPDPAAYERFAAGFAFTETADQASAIAAVRADLASGRPMDRLVVGDVGYGKTEVALRAAAIAALGGRQVAIAAPTTVLARQHLETFRARFADTGLVVAGLSRLSSAAERKAVRAGLADGSVHIVVGTAAVAGKGITYHDLGLVVVDEEQRFGAADKARLRALSAGHVLTLTATPIPRTLQSALVGLQQLSVIATPPARRQPIRTAVSAFAPETLRAALLRERSRGGQSFVVVPRIADMDSLADTLAKAVPELEILQAHGKMPPADLDETMVRFGRGEGDVLLATNIIEAGLDVPRANTMAIWRADRFGLSQLHQLRGRVGRGNRRGQVLLFTDGEHAIAPRTLKRLRTLEAFDRLGAGFAISARDLDMRGAGDLMGETQAGHMKLIGVDLYQTLFEGALRTTRGEAVDRWQPDLDVGVGGRLPPSWIPDEDTRIDLYVRLARIADEEALAAFEDEIEDRFGEIPAEAATLLAIAGLRISAREAGIARVAAGPGAIAVEPRGKTRFDADALGLEAKGDRLLLRERIEDPTERLARARALIGAMAEQVG